MDDRPWEKYEAQTGMSKDSYAQRLLTAARYQLMESPWEGDFDEHDVPHRHGLGGLPEGKVESVEIEGQGIDRTIVVLFRLNDHPGSLFGWRIPIWRFFAAEDCESPEDGVELLPVYLDDAIVAEASRIILIW